MYIRERVFNRVIRAKSARPGRGRETRRSPPDTINTTVRDVPRRAVPSVNWLRAARGPAAREAVRRDPISAACARARVARDDTPPRRVRPNYRRQLWRYACTSYGATFKRSRPTSNSKTETAIDRYFPVARPYVSPGSGRTRPRRLG